MAYGYYIGLMNKVLTIMNKKHCYKCNGKGRLSDINRTRCDACNGYGMTLALSQNLRVPIELEDYIKQIVRAYTNAIFLENTLDPNKNGLHAVQQTMIKISNNIREQLYEKSS